MCAVAELWGDEPGDGAAVRTERFMLYLVIYDGRLLREAARSRTGCWTFVNGINLMWPLKILIMYT